ncbi:CHAD domain-containing protein [Devosia sp. BK]|uniref:CHAD domain-containing protein n=1 Tax=Devosia sp. BK TaxID=2871706 RepID=UPI00293A104C|nr:CHAD domain-containing protein [Devosia sp. BK]MDV3250551.1 CHAD domain-containing protein [Devosia sp. BK]
MSFSFKQRKDTPAQVRQIAADQITSAIELAEAYKDFDKTVHGLRRRCKKIRGLIRLVRPNFKEFEAENAAFRDAATALSVSRDAAVMVETYDAAMQEPWAADFPHERKQNLRALLTSHLDEVKAEQNQSQLLADFALAMQNALGRVPDWSLSGDGFQLFRAGLGDTYSEMQKRMKKAAKSHDPVDFHEWRKQSKGHWFHIGLLSKSAPHILATRKAHLDTLGDLLGDHHNIAVLADFLSQRAGPLDVSLREGLAGQQQALAEKAIPLGRELCVENRAALAARLGKFWKLLPKDI